MRKSRVVLIGVAVAAAAATSTAFTAANSFAGPNIAGYGESTVSGAHVTDTLYTKNTSDPSTLVSVKFLTSNDVSAATATLAVTDASTPTPNSLGGTITCVPSTTDITCTFGTPIPIASISKVALTVLH